MIRRRHWTCGDGCCSDSWYEIVRESTGEIIFSTVYSLADAIELNKGVDPVDDETVYEVDE